MKRVFDFLYYFIYQLNRRGYKKFNYENARVGLSVIIFIFFLSFSRLIHPVLQHFADLEISNEIWGVISLVTSISMTFYFATIYYGPNGSRTWVVKYYDKNTNIRKQNSVILCVALSTLLVCLVVSCKIIGWRLADYLYTH